MAFSVFFMQLKKIFFDQCTNDSSIPQITLLPSSNVFITLFPLIYVILRLLQSQHLL